MSEDHDRTASLMSPAKLAQMKPRAAASPAAWLDQMASDAGHMHVRQLGELAGRLREQATADRGDAPLSEALAGVAAALPRVDVSLLQPQGWLARATGKARSAAAEFAAQYEEASGAATALRQQAAGWQERHAAIAGARERTLLEFEVEWRAIDKIIDQGARWLQDMRNQLKARQAAGGDAAVHEQIRQDAARCELLVTRLKLLRALATGAQQVQQQAQAVGARRAALLQVQQQGLAADLKEWQARSSPLAAAAGAGAPAARSLDSAEASSRQLQQRVAQCQADLGQLAAQEQALAGALGELAQQLSAAA